MENHLITIDNRQTISITEVADIDNFDEEEIYADLREGGLIVRGKGLHLQKLDLAEGRAVITGEIISLNYTNRENRGGKGLLQKILK